MFSPMSAFRFNLISPSDSSDIGFVIMYFAFFAVSHYLVRTRISEVNLILFNSHLGGL